MDTLTKSDIKIYVTLTDADDAAVIWENITALTVTAQGNYSKLERSIAGADIYTEESGNFYFWLTREFLQVNDFIDMTGLISSADPQLSDASQDIEFKIGGTHEVI